MDIFEDVMKKIKCEYISDLPNHKDEIIRLFTTLSLNNYSLEQLEDFSLYVFQSNVLLNNLPLEANGQNNKDNKKHTKN